MNKVKENPDHSHLITCDVPFSSWYACLLDYVNILLTRHGRGKTYLGACLEAKIFKSTLRMGSY